MNRSYEEEYKRVKAERREKLLAEITREYPSLVIQPEQIVQTDLELYVYLDNMHYIVCDGLDVWKRKTDLCYAKEFLDRHGWTYRIIVDDDIIYLLGNTFTDIVRVTRFRTNDGKKARNPRYFRKYYRDKKGQYFRDGQKKIYFGGQSK